MRSFVDETFLARLTDAERESLFQTGSLRTFERGTALMLQGDMDNGVALMLAGRAKVTRLDQDGREVLLSIRDPGDLLGELAFIDGQPRVATVTALEPLEAVVTSAPTLRRHLESTPRVAVVLLETLVSRFRETTVKRSQFASSDTMGRLAARVVELVDRYGERAEQGWLVSSPLSQEDLASWTGASRAGVAEALHALRELGWIETQRMKLIVHDLEALRARAG